MYTAPVGRFQANAWGLYDMSGNIWEWTCSIYDQKYDGAESRCINRNEPGVGVIRGATWSHNPSELRSAFRMPAGFFTYRDTLTGFRLARSL